MTTDTFKESAEEAATPVNPLIRAYAPHAAEIVLALLQENGFSDLDMSLLKNQPAKKEELERFGEETWVPIAEISTSAFDTSVYEKMTLLGSVGRLQSHTSETFCFLRLKVNPRADAQEAIPVMIGLTVDELGTAAGRIKDVRSYLVKPGAFIALGTETMEEYKSDPFQRIRDAFALTPARLSEQTMAAFEKKHSSRPDPYGMAYNAT